MSGQLEHQLRELQAQFEELQTAFNNKDLEVVLFTLHVVQDLGLLGNSIVTSTAIDLGSVGFKHYY